MKSTVKASEDLFDLLDLREFIARFYTFLAREKSFVLQGDITFYKKILDELDKINFPQIPQMQNLDSEILHLKKSGTLNLAQIFSFIKIMRYFSVFKNLTFITPEMMLYEMLHNIKIPQGLQEILKIFDDEGCIKAGIYPQFDHLNLALLNLKSKIKSELSMLLSLPNLQPYLIDKQIHLINQTQTLLLKAGFSKAIKGTILMRSQSGFFYLLPQSIQALYQKQKDLEDELELTLFKICEEISHIFSKHILFLGFINKEFDRFDLLCARINFAKSENLEFILPTKNTHKIILHEFSHPILTAPKPLNIDFSKNLLVVTGVNAGGKTMLLKSILSSSFLAKNLLPFKINPHKSQIPHFKNIHAIIADPQNTKNDISTFAGRMLNFSKILNCENMLLGVDEIELGTDSDEASSLYKTLLEILLDKGAKLIITTHHKRLAALIANDSRVQICAALYDIKRGVPMFEFMQGSIGKSYAFETAVRYGIPRNIVNLAIEHYGKDKERLNELIEKSTKLELELKSKNIALDKKIQEYEAKKSHYENLSENLKQEYERNLYNLEQTYKEALEILKQQVKTMPQAHQNITKANKIRAQIKDTPIKSATQTKTFAINDCVKYGAQRGKILSINGENCFVELDSGMRLKIQAQNLKSTPNIPEYSKIQKSQSIKITSQLNVSLDLHGLRADEAIEKMDKFLSDSLLAGFDEVLIYHGIGTGRLSRVVKEFLEQHPKVLSFEDAPPNMGGMSAKIVRL